MGTAVEPPASDFERHTIGDLLSVSVPSNWVEMEGPDTVRFAPRGVFSEERGRQSFTHGIEIGSLSVRTSNLVEASDALVEALRANNPGLKVIAPAEQARFAGRAGLRVHLTQPSMAGGAEIVTIHTALVEERMFYSVAVVPEKDYDAYRSTFERVNESIRISK